MLVKNKCINCGKEYEYEPKKGTYKFKYCSLKCRDEYAVKDNASQFRICEYCGKKYWWDNTIKSYGKIGNFIDAKRFCCYECGKAAKYEKVKETTIKNYGGIGYASKELLKRTQDTKLEKYGSLNNYEKIKQTNLDKYGVEVISKASVVKNKLKEIASKKTEQDWKDRDIKSRATKYDRYGNENYVNKEKTKQTNLTKYGVEVASKSQVVKDKIATTNLVRYGFKAATKNKDIANKIHNSWQNKSEEELKAIEEKRKITTLKLYKTEYTSQNDNVKATLYKNNIKKYGTPYIIQVEKFRKKAMNTTMERYGVPYNCLTESCINANANLISKVNLQFKDKLDRLNIESKLEFNIGKYSYDFKVDNILVEIDPAYTHNSTVNVHIGKSLIEPKPITYHYNKTKLAIENGYRCIHIWDWDDEDKIIQLLLPKEKLYARNLQIKEISLDICRTFLYKYHLQNSCNGQNIRLGLYKDNELIEVMTFGKSRYNKNYEYELLRLCTKNGYKVVGGAEKLFSYFIKQYNPKTIISYCDNSKFLGDVYKRLGMELKSYGSPSCHWVNIKTDRHITDNLLRQRGYSQLHNDKEHKKGESNEVLMLNAGYIQIYDCGQSVYVWRSNEKI